MVKVWVSVEGLTEEIFIKAVLVPCFSQQGINMFVVNIKGDIKLEKVQKELHKLAHYGGYVTSMYDFYGFKNLDPEETKISLEDKIKNGLDQSIAHKVFPYIQMHEFEGILFSSPEILGNSLEGKGLSNVSMWARNILDSFENDPEKINNSRQTAPSKRLEKETNYKKTIHGSKIAKEIGLPFLRKKCQGFNAWITMIESWVQ